MVVDARAKGARTETTVRDLLKKFAKMLFIEKRWVKPIVSGA